MLHPSRHLVVWAAPLLGLLIVIYGISATAESPLSDRFKIDTPDKTLSIWGFLPNDYPDQKSYGLILFIGEAQPNKPEYLAELLVPEKQLPQLATEMGAIVAFLMIGKDDLDKNYLLIVRYAMKQIITKYAVDENRLAIVGYKSAALTAAKAMLTDPRYPSALVLVEPGTNLSTLQPPGAKAPAPNSRPVLILTAAEDRPDLAEKTRAILGATGGFTNVLSDRLTACDRLPAHHIHAFSKYAFPTLRFNIARAWTEAKALPEKGDERRNALEELTCVLPGPTPSDFSLSAPPTLKSSTAAPLTAGPFFDQLRVKLGELAATESELFPLVQKKLADEKALAEKQLAALRESLKMAAQLRRQGEYKRFRDDNFPWPELTDALMAAKPAAAKPEAVAAGKPLPPVTDKQFAEVIKAKCVRCHRNSGDTTQMKLRRWILPGNPDKSPLYTCLGIGKNRKLENGKYHDVSDDEKLKIYSYIKTLPP